MRNGAKFVFIAVQTGNMKNDSPGRSFFRFRDSQKADFVSLDDVVPVSVIESFVGMGKQLLKLTERSKQAKLLTSKV